MRDTASVTDGEPVGTRRDFVWGFVAQVFSSAANFGLVLMAGRILGPAGLGMVVIGYAGCQLVAGLQRAIVTQPIVAHASPLSPPERRTFAEAGLTIVGGSGLVAVFLVGATGLIVGGSVGRALLLFTPWLIVALLQEYWKAVLFQEGSSTAGAVSECIRLGTMAAILPVALAWQHDYVVVSAWGLATASGLAVAIASFPMRPRAMRASVDLWHRHASRLGRWLGAREALYQVLTYATVIVLALIIGTRDLGGLRSAEALFSPFSLIAAALVLPALPALSRAVAVSHQESSRLAIKISLVATALASSYFLVMALIGPWLLTRLFGRAFSSFDDLIWPIAVAQLFYAAAFSFNLLLSAEKRGQDSFVAGTVLSIATSLCATSFAGVHGVAGAAWGMSAGAAIGSTFVVWLSVRRPGPVESVP